MYKRILSTILSIVLIIALVPSAFAWETSDDDYIGADVTIDEAYEKAKAILERDEGKDLAQIASENAAIVWHYNPYGEATIPDPVLELSEGDGFDALVEKLFTKYGVYSDIENEYLGHISLGYLNLVTGEEHYFGEDTSIVAASLFKIPENMIMCDKVYNGEITFDTEINGEPYKFHQYRTISKSDNERALSLYAYLGGYIVLKQLEREYIGEEPFAEGEYIDGGDIRYTPKQVITALKSVYNEPERFNGIIQNMLQAQPYEYFKMFQRDYVVAQKYGFLTQTEATGEHSYINCCAIVYTEEPIAIVCMTDNVSKAYDVIGEYCCLASQLEELNLSKEIEPEESAETEIQEDAVQATPDLSSELTDIEETAVYSEKIPDSENEKKETKMSLLSCIVIGLITVVMLYCLVIIFRRNGGGEVNGLFAMLSVILAALAMTICVIASQIGTLYAKPSGDPSETVNGFFSSLRDGSFGDAYAYLEDYAGLGLENPASSVEGQWMQQALYRSYDYALKGNASVDKLTAKQTLMFRYLDLALVEENAKDNVDEVLREVVDSKKKSELYDENGQYVSEVTDEVYNTALERALENSEEFYRTVELTVNLNYVDGQWLMTMSDELLSYLMGGVSQ